MRYVLEEKIFCLGDDYTICDQGGHECFIVDGRAFSVGNKLSFQDTVGNELAFIRQKLLAWGPTYEIYREGRLAAIVRKQMFTFFNCRFMVDVPGAR